MYVTPEQIAATNKANVDAPLSTMNVPGCVNRFSIKASNARWSTEPSVLKSSAPSVNPSPAGSASRGAVRGAPLDHASCRRFSDRGVDL